MSKIIEVSGVLDNKITKEHKRVGRGRGSGLGKTCGKGQKGQKARTGVSIRWFEGGQTPLYIRLPRRGFNNIFRTEFVALNFLDVAKYIASGRLNSKITIESLIAAEIVKKNQLVKILAKGECPKGVSIEAHAFSQSAISAIKDAGGNHSVAGGVEQKA